MRRFLLLLLFVIAYTLGLTAQDVIIMRKGVEVKGKVEEITDNEIKYRKADNLTGPLYTISKSEVFMIKYANGSKETFSNSESPGTTPENKERLKEAHEPTPRHERVREERSRGPRERRERAPRRQEDLRSNAQRRITGGAVMTGIGIPALAAGGTLMGIALDDMTGHSANKYHIDDVPVLACGIALTAIGTVLTVLGPVNLAKGLRDKGMAGATLDFKPITNPALNRYNGTFSRQTIGTLRITF